MIVQSSIGTFGKQEISVLELLDKLSSGKFERDAEARGILQQPGSFSLDDILGENDEDINDELILMHTSQQEKQQEYLISLSNTPSTPNKPTFDRIPSERSSPTNEQRRSRSNSRLSLVSLASRKTGFDTEATHKRRQKYGPVVKGHIVRRLSQVLASSTTRNTSGLPAVMAICPAYMAIGTTRGLILLFDVQHALRMTLGGSDSGLSAGAVTAADLSYDGSRLLVGYERGLVVRWETSTGRILNKITDAHSSPILHVTFTDDRRLIVSHEAKGTVHMHNFKRVMGLRTSDRTCVVHADRKAVSTMKVLKYNSHSSPANFVLMAASSLSDLHIILLCPELKVVRTLRSPNTAGASLSCLAWNLVPISSKENNTTIMQPVLAMTWGSSIVFIKATPKMSDCTVSPLKRQYDSDVPIVAISWMSDHVVMALDTNEHAHIIDIQSNTLVDMLDLSRSELVFNTRFTKEKLGSNLMALDDKSWKERVTSLVKQGMYVKAITLGLSFYNGTALATHNMPQNAAKRRTVVKDFMINIIDTYVDLSLASNSLLEEKTIFDVDKNTTENQNGETKELFADIASEQEVSGNRQQSLREIDSRFKDIVNLVINSFLEIDAEDFLFTVIFDKLTLHQVAISAFFDALSPLILEEKISYLPPTVMKAFVEHLKNRNRPDIVEECVIRMDVTTMDLHQMVSLCWEYKLFDAMIYIYNQGMNDYITPLREMMQLLQASIRARSADVIAGGSLQEFLNDQERELGYKLLLYISFCLAGRAFPRGDIPRDRVRRVRWEVYRFVLMQHGEQGESSSYPYLRSLLYFDTKEFLNVLSIAFDENDLHAQSTDTGPALPSRQVVVETLLFVMVKDNKGHRMLFSPEQVCHLFTFIARQVSKHDNVISVDRALFDQVLRRLTTTDLGKKDEQEQALLGLLDAGGMEQFDTEKLLATCEQAGFYMVCERVYAIQGRYSDIVFCYLRDKFRNHLVFPYIHRCLVQQRIPPSEIQKIKQATIDHLQDFVRISPQDTAKLILKCFRPQLSIVVANVNFRQLADRLSANPDLHYEFLKHVFKQRDSIPDDKVDEIPSDLEMKYLGVMCRNHPTHVYTYLRQHDGLNCEQCLVLTKRYKLTDATAWLLEKMEKFLEAFALMRAALIKQLGSYNQAFENLENHMLENKLTSPPSPDSRETHIKSFKKFLSILIDMMERCSDKMSEAERRNIWCQTLEALMESQQLMKTKLQRTANDYAILMNMHMKELVRHMAVFVDPPAILHLIMSGDNTWTDRFDDIRDLVIGMLETYNYERTQLQATNFIVQNDVFSLMEDRQRAIRHAYSSTQRCDVTHQVLCGNSNTNDDIVMLRSGHCMFLNSLPRIPRRFQRQSNPSIASGNTNHLQNALTESSDSAKPTSEEYYEDHESYLRVLMDTQKEEYEENFDPQRMKHDLALERFKLWEQHTRSSKISKPYVGSQRRQAIASRPS
eukprot:gene3329-6013_t